MSMERPTKLKAPTVRHPLSEQHVVLLNRFIEHFMYAAERIKTERDELDDGLYPPEAAQDVAAYITAHAELEQALITALDAYDAARDRLYGTHATWSLALDDDVRWKAYNKRRNAREKREKQVRDALKANQNS